MPFFHNHWRISFRQGLKTILCQHHCSILICLSLFSVTQTILGCFPKLASNIELICNCCTCSLTCYSELCSGYSESHAPILPPHPHHTPQCTFAVNSSPITPLCVWISWKKTNLADREQRWKKINVKSNERVQYLTLECRYLLYASDLWTRTFPHFISQCTKQPWVRDHTSVPLPQI